MREWRFNVATVGARRIGAEAPLAIKAAAIAAAVVMLAILGVLIIPAALVFGVVLLLGRAVLAVRRAIDRIRPDPSGRRNVRVITRHEPL